MQFGRLLGYPMEPITTFYFEIFPQHYLSLNSFICVTSSLWSKFRRGRLVCGKVDHEFYLKNGGGIQINTNWPATADTAFYRTHIASDDS